MTRHQHKRIKKRLIKAPTLRKGQIARRIIGKLIDDGKGYTLHATKGYRRTHA